MGPSLLFEDFLQRIVFLQKHTSPSVIITLSFVRALTSAEAMLSITRALAEFLVHVSPPHEPHLGSQPFQVQSGAVVLAELP